MFRLSGLIFLLVSLLTSLVFAQTELIYETEIIVTATRIPQRLTDQPWSTAVITSSEIENSGAQNVAELLYRTAGIDISSNGYQGGVATARLRGASSQQTLVLLNGRPITSPTLGLTDLGVINLDNVERIEVVKSPLSAIYGADAVGGVINIITKKGTADRHFKFLVENGDFASKKHLFQVSGRNYFLSFSNSLSEGFRTNSDYDAKNYAAGFSWNDFSLNLKRYEDKKGSPGSLSFPSSTARSQNNNDYIDLSYSNKAEKTNIGAFVNVLENMYMDPLYFINTTTRTQTYGLEGDKTFLLPVGEFLAGFDLRRDVSNSSASGANNLNNGGIFLQNKFSVPYGYLFAGARTDFFSHTGYQISPRVGGVFLTLPDTTIKTSLARAFKSPTINDLYWASQSFTFGGVTYTTVGNLNLKPEYAYSFDLSIEKNWGDSSVKWSYFLNKITDMIRWETTSTPTSITYQPRNIVNVEVNGMELEMMKKLSKWMKIFANYTWQDAQNEAWVKYVTYSPKNKYNVGISFDHPELSVSCIQRFVGERYTDFMNTTMLEGYAVTDLTVVRRFAPFIARGKIENLFNVNYQELAGYPHPGRRYSVGFGYESQ